MNAPLYRPVYPQSQFVAMPKTREQFVSGLVPMSSIVQTLQSQNLITAQTAATLKYPVGWGIAILGSYLALSKLKSRQELALGVAAACIGGAAAFEVLDGLASSSAPAAAA